MGKYKGKYRIESNRAHFWDYSSPAEYFITICVANRECIFDDVVDSKMILTEYGKIVQSEIEKMPQYHKRVIMDESIVMPNHIHMIVTLGDYGFDNGVSMIDGDGGGHGHGDDDVVERIHEFSLQPPTTQPPTTQPPTTQPTTTPSSTAPTTTHWWHNPNHKPTIDEIKQYRKHRRKMLIPKILGKFKHQTSKQINILRNTPGIKNWQANFHDHIIRDNKSYHNIKNYIINNPANWRADKFNPNDEL